MTSREAGETACANARRGCGGIYYEPEHLCVKVSKILDKRTEKEMCEGGDAR